jgi:hypothetical protein
VSFGLEEAEGQRWKDGCEEFSMENLMGNVKG